MNGHVGMRSTFAGEVICRLYAVPETSAHRQESEGTVTVSEEKFECMDWKLKAKSLSWYEYEISVTSFM